VRRRARQAQRQTGTAASGAARDTVAAMRDRSGRIAAALYLRAPSCLTAGQGRYAMQGVVDITQQLSAAQAGDAASLDALFPVVYDELKRLARAALARERGGHTLQPTALVHEAYLRLVAQHVDGWSGRAYFFGLAASMMRRILVNHARDRAAQKRGGGAAAVTLSQAEGLADGALDVVELHEALDTLARLDARQARVVELKFFGGLEIEEIAEVLGVSPATVRRDCTMARLWLGRELSA
jgi:RNA polymerase sigma-70 factor, ECF subfamily